jgi:Flp pilus assembly protein TadG
MIRRLRRHDASRPPAAERTRGQALVEFSLVLIPFLIIMMGIFDLGRGIYMMNTTAQAAREIARVTIVHPYDTCCDMGSSTEVQAVVATQRGLLPNMTFTPGTDITCVDISDVTIPDNQCNAGDFIKVRVRAPFSAVTPLVSAFGTHTFESYARVKLQTEFVNP